MAKQQTPATDFPDQTNRAIKNDAPGKPPRVQLTRNVGGHLRGETFSTPADAEKAGAKVGDYQELSR